MGLCFNIKDMPPNFEPNFTPTPPQPVNQPNTPPPVPSPLRRDHSIPVGEQHTVDINNLPKNAGNNLFQSEAPIATPPANYDFILNPAPQKQPLKLGLPGSWRSKLGIGIIALVALIILISIIGSLTKGSSNLPYMESVVEDQQELIHVLTNAYSVPDISSNNKTFVATAVVTLGSNTSVLQSYLKNIGSPMPAKYLKLKINKTVDQEMSSAETAGNFNQSFAQIASGQLNTYLSDLLTDLNKTAGRRGRSLLISQINQAKLLQVSLANGS